MPVSTVESPYGLLQVEHPEGASDEEILKYAQQNYKAEQPKSFQEKLMETWPAKMAQGAISGFMAPGQAWKGELGLAGSRELTQQAIQPAAEIAGLAAGDTQFAHMVPSKDQIFEAGSKAFNAARDLGAKFHPDLIANFSNIAKQDLTSAGFTPKIAEKVHGILDDHATTSYFRQPTTVDDILGFRKVLNKAQGFTDPQEKAAATIAKHAFDSVVDNVAPFTVEGNGAQAANLLREGRQNWAAAERLDTLDTRQAAAELRASAANSGMNIANKLRQNLASVLLSPKQSAGWSPEAINQATRVVEGTPVGNTARYVGNLAGKGGGLGGLAATGTAALVGGAPLATGVAGIGIGAHLIDKASTLRQMALLRALLSRESPLAQGMPGSTVPSDVVSKLASMLLSNQMIPNMTNTLSSGSQTQ